jgi:hypothetical protein
MASGIAQIWSHNRLTMFVQTVLIAGVAKR